MMNYKDCIQQRAEEIALKRFNTDFYKLGDIKQIDVWGEAEQDYVDHEAARIDAAYDATQERKFDR